MGCSRSTNGVIHEQRKISDCIECPSKAEQGKKKKGRKLKKYRIQAKKKKSTSKWSKAHEEIRRSRDKAGLGHNNKPKDSVLIVSIKKWLDSKETIRLIGLVKRPQLIYHQEDGPVGPEGLP